jgi:hypothetical protein
MNAPLQPASQAAHVAAGPTQRILSIPLAYQGAEKGAWLHGYEAGERAASPAQAAPVAAIRDQALEDAAKECENQVPPGCSTHIADVARNQGIRACTDVIRAMKGAT